MTLSTYLLSFYVVKAVEKFIDTPLFLEVPLSQVDTVGKNVWLTDGSHRYN